MIPRIAYVAFAAQTDPPTTVAGKLHLPTREAKPRSLPAVVICHGSDGVDGRGEFHARALHKAGIATLEIDMWAARGTERGSAARPASPIQTLPDAFAALKFLGRQPEIDAGRIGIMGFSWGGAVTLLAAARPHSDLWRGEAAPFAAHAAFYPVCWAYRRLPALSLIDLGGAPILIQTGDADAYDPPGAAEALVIELRKSAAAEIRWLSHAGATHGFDRDLAPQTIQDPFSHGGAGGDVLMAHDPRAAAAARGEVADFFSRTLRESRPPGARDGRPTHRNTRMDT